MNKILSTSLLLIVVFTKLNAQSCFTPNWSGTGLGLMNFSIGYAVVNSLNLRAGDEIGIFDGDACVGAGVLTNELSGGAYITIATSKDDPATLDKDGFTENNPVSFRFCRGGVGIITNVLANNTSGSGVFLSNSTVTVELTGLPVPFLPPVAGQITQPTCAIPTGTVELNNFPTGSWTINPGNISGSTSNVVISGLQSGNYTFVVTDGWGTSVSTSVVVINAKPVTPTAPIIGTITPTTCTNSTGSVEVKGLPSTGIWTIVRNPGGIILTATGTTYTITGLMNGTYTFTVTNSEGCVSAASAEVLIPPQPLIPEAPVAGTIIPPTCTLSTGSVTFNNLPQSGSWTLTRYPGTIITSGTGVSTTITNLLTGTYNYTITNSAGCVSVPSSNIEIQAQPVTPPAPVPGTISQPVCTVGTGSAELNGLPPNGNWILTQSPGGTTTAGAGITKILTGLTPGTYSYTVTNAEGCVSVSSQNVVIDAQPITPTAPTIGSIIQPTCIVATGDIVLSGLPSTGTWTLTRNPGSVTTPGTGSTTTISGLSAGTYTFIVVNAAGCISAASSDLVINPQPLSPTIPLQSVDCSLGYGKASVTEISHFGPDFDYRLDEGTFQILNVFSEVSNGNHSLTIRNKSGCTTTGNIFTINCGCINPPSVSLTSNSGNTCYTTPVEVSGNEFRGSATSILITTNGSGLITTSSSSISPFSFIYTPDTGDAGKIVTITVTTNNPLGVPCVPATATYSLTVNALPPAPIASTITQPGCTLASGSVLLNGLPSAGTWRIRQTPGDVLTDGSGSSTIISGLTSGTYTFSVTNSAGCTSIPSSDVVINSQPVTPTVLVNNPQAVCSPSKVNIAAAEVTAGSSPELTYSYWTNSSATAAYSTPSVAEAGIYYIKGTTTAGCFDIKPVTITVNPLPSGDAGSGGNACDLNFILNAKPSFGIGTWSKTSGPGTSIFTPNANLPTATVSVSDYGSYTFRWTEVSNGCLKSSSIIVNFLKQPVINAGMGGTSCNLSFTLSAVQGIGTGSWSKTNGPGTVTFSPNANTPGAIATVTAYGDYTFNWTEINGTCSNNKPVNVKYVQPPLSSAGNDVSICGYENILKATPAAGSAIGTWTKASGPGNASFSPSSNQASSKVKVDTYGTYDFAWTVTSNTCQSSDLVRVVFKPLPLIYAGRDTAICKNQNIQLQAIGTGSFQWLPSEILTNASIKNPVAKPLTSTTFKVILTDLNGCRDSDLVWIEVRDLPLVYAGPDQVLENVLETSTSASVPGLNETGTWSILSGSGEFADISDCDTRIRNLPIGDNIFIWSVTNRVCPIVKDSITITVHNLNIPTLITPNMDGKNDYLILTGIETLGKTEIIIFDRRGSQVYKNSNYVNEWNGVDFNGNPLPDDTYFYVLKSSKGKTASGYIVIRR